MNYDAELSRFMKIYERRRCSRQTLPPSRDVICFCFALEKASFLTVHLNRTMLTPLRAHVKKATKQSKPFK